MKGINTRDVEIDGIRGWAAFMVICFHFFTELFGNLFSVFHSSFFGFLFDGQLMVLIFFILSGDALSHSFFKNKSPESTVRLVLVRYFRLTFPILITCSLAYFIMITGLNYNLIAADIVDRNDWLGQFLTFKPSLNSLFRYSLSNVYFHHEALKSYNPFLWTMSIEMFGSMLIFLNIFILNRVKNIWKILVLEFLFFLIFEPYYCLFIAGMILGGVRANGYLDKLRNLRFNPVFLILFFAIIVYISIARESDSVALRKSIKDMYAVWAVFVVTLIYLNKSLITFFSNKLSKFLGEISFPLYAIQFLVMVTLSSYLVIYYNEHGGVTLQIAIFIASVSIAFTILFALGFRVIERKFLEKINSWINNKVLINK